MIGIMNGLAKMVSGLFDLLVAPMAGNPALAMLVLSVISAVWALLLFKAVTPQKKLAVGRDRLFGHIFEMGLFQDHLSVLGKIQFDLAKANLRYMLLTLPALLVLTLPMVLTLAQLDSRFSRRPLHPGEKTVFSVNLKEGNPDGLAGLTLAVPAGVVVEAGPVRDRAKGALAWRLRGDLVGDHLLKVMLDGKVLAERILPVGDGLPRVNEHNKHGLFARILAPGAITLAGDSPVDKMTLHLPSRSTTYFGVELNWLVAFMVFSMLGGLLLKDVLRVSL